VTCKTCGNPLRTTQSGGDKVCPHCTMTSLFDDPDISLGSEEVDDYDIQKEIGRGGDGTVYLGYDQKVGRQVAIKLINSDRRVDETTERRFQAESESIASLDHPNIIPIYANGRMDGRPFYTMKYVTGGNLDTRLDDFAKPGVAVALMIKIARAVHHAHERGILHRDLKPSNILLDEQLEPYISDFGLAKRFDENLNLTLTGAVMGTPSYMSPEQARGDNAQITTTSDVFSLGSIFYHVLTGRLPFIGDSSHHVLRSVIETQIRFPRETRHLIDKDLETICLKCLEKDPERRYPSALALVEDLERWQKHFPVRARRATAMERARRWIRRHPLPAGALALATLSLITGTIVSLILWQKAEQARLLSDQARDLAEENAYFSNIENAISARENFDLGETRRLLDEAPVARRGFEWELVNGLSTGDQEWIKTLEIPAVKLTYDRANKRIVILLQDRTYHEVNLEDGTLSPLGKLPDTPAIDAKFIDLEYPGLREFSFSPDGKHYLFMDDSQVLVTSSETDELVFQSLSWRGGSTCWIDSNRIVNAHRSMDRTHQVKPGIYAPSAWIYDLQKNKQTNLSPRAWAGPIQLSPDGSQVAITTRNRLVEVYPISAPFEGEPLHTFSSEHGHIKDISFSPDGNYLAFSSIGTEFRHHIFDLHSGKAVFKQDWPTSTQFCFTKTPGSPPNLILAGRQPWLTSWQFFNQPSSILTFDDGHAKSSTYQQNGPFSPPSNLLTRYTSDGRTSFFFGHTGPINSLIPLPSNQGFITMSQDNTLRRWPAQPSVANRQSMVSTNLFYMHPTASHNGDYLAYQDKQHRHVVWHRPSNTTIRIPKSQVYLAVFNDGRVLTRVIKSSDIICSQITPSGNLKKLWQHHPGITSAGNYFQLHTAVTPNEKHVAVLHPARILTVDMDAQTGQTIPDQGMTFGSSPGQYTAISDDGRLTLMTGVKGPNARIYQTHHLDKGYRELVPLEAHTTRDSAGVFSRDGSLVYVGNNDGRVRVFETATLKERPGLGWLAHRSEVTAMALSQKGDVIATAGGDTTILWSTQKASDKPRRQRLRLKTGSTSRNWLQFCGNDSLLMHSGTDTPIEIWPALKSGAKPQRIPTQFFRPKIPLSGATVRQSSQYSLFEAKIGIDGIYSNYTHTAPEDLQPWWEISLPRETPIGTVKIYNRVDCCGERLSNLFLTISDSAGKSLYQSEILNSENTLQSPDALTIELPKPLSAQTIRITRKQKLPDDVDTILSIGEVELFPPSPPENTGK